MGNSGSSHQQQVTLIEGPPHSWAHSFPRTTSFKVLPDRVPGQRLRLTDNGAILHNGGTISGRKPYPFEPQPKIQGYRNGVVPSADDYRRTLYGSEPDLRYPREAPHSYGPPSHQSYYNNNNDNSVKARIGKSRKKYKAPLAPHINSTESSSPDSYHRWETSADSSEVTAPSRRSRLFKTRAETKRPSVDHAPPKNFSQLQKPGAVPGMLQRSLSSPQFQDELTAKLRERAVREPPIGKAADSPHHSPVLKYRESISQPRREVPRGYEASRKQNGKAHYVNEKLPYQNGNSRSHLENGPSSKAYRVPNATDTMDVGRNRNGLVGKYVYRNNSEKREKPPATKKTEKPAAPVKRFYFGMEGEAQPEPHENDDTSEVDKFAAALRKAPLITETSPSDSYSSEQANFDNPAGILLKLRPTLPRKQLEIPRFSPTAAWRLLSALESPTHSEEDDLVLMEEQIPHPQIDRPYTVKSADSGISGDTSPQHHDSTHNSQMAWTPQQDLEETSSDGGLESAPVSPESAGTAAKFSPRFSLSLPKEEKTLAYSDKVHSDAYASSNFQNARKVKRSMSGALNRNANEVAISSLDENWLLSRSVPNLGLFNNAYVRRWAESCPPSTEQDEDPSGSLSKPSSFSYLANGGHVMYLPEYKNTMQKESPHSGTSSPGLPPFSKSCDDLLPDLANEHQLDLNHGPTENEQRMVNGSRNTPANNKGKSRKFTFQSTIRQIERKKIAEKLSREAEEKERRRLRESEAMKKVEEEFQRKREREKADIRHQLRLYNLTEGTREQPDGAVLPPPARTTQVLSEFRQPRRDYRDYTPQRASDADSVSHSDLGIKRETVHPEVVYKIPKNAQVYVTPHHSHPGNGQNYLSGASDSPRSFSSSNYRKDFAQGALPRSIASSDSELSQPNTRPMSRTKQRSRSSSLAEDENLEEHENDGIFPDPDYDSDDNDDINELDTRDNGRTNKHIANLINIFKPETPPRSKKMALQPYIRNKTYKPVSFKPSSDKIAQVIS